MLRPLMQHLMPVEFLRSENGVTLFNLEHWVVYSVDKWLETLLDLEAGGVVRFTRGGLAVLAIELDIVASLRTQLALAFDRSDSSREVLCVGFTNNGGKVWEDSIGIDWTPYYSMITDAESFSVDVTVVSVQAIELFDRARSWRGHLVSRVRLIDYWPFYWRRFGVAYALHYALDSAEFEYFMKSTIARSHGPAINSEKGDGEVKGT